MSDIKKVREEKMSWDKVLNRFIKEGLTEKDM